VQRCELSAHGLGVTTSRWLLAGVSALVVLAAAACAVAPAEPAGADPAGADPARDGGAASEPVAVDPGTELYAQTTLLQEGDGEPQLCLGGVMESYPPQCGGLVVVGLDWDDVADAETASGTTWGTGWVVGTYDAEAGTFTLTRPVAGSPPDGVDVPTPEPMDFPALCDDPYRGGEEEFDATSPEGMAAQDELMVSAAGLDGYIGLYVSDGASEFNVLVQADAEAAHDALREVWPGWLCVATGGGATEADVLAGQQALHDELGEVVLGSGGGGVDGMLHVQVVVADEATTQAVLAAVEPWLTPEQVVVEGALQPIPG
jgi:hypothetical protein